MNCDLGYKVCYKKKNKSRLKTHIVTNSKWLADFEKKRCETYPQYNRKNKKLIRNVVWDVFPVKNLKEFNKLWKTSPF